MYYFLKWQNPAFISLINNGNDDKDKGDKCNNGEYVAVIRIGAKIQFNCWSIQNSRDCQQSVRSMQCQYAFFIGCNIGDILDNYTNSITPLQIVFIAG